MKTLLSIISFLTLCLVSKAQKSMSINPADRQNMAAAMPGEVNPPLPAVSGSANANDSFSRAMLVHYIAATKKIPAAQLAKTTDSLSKAHGVRLMNKEGIPLNLLQAAQAGELVLMGDEVIYLPTGTSTRRIISGDNQTLTSPSKKLQ